MNKLLITIAAIAVSGSAANAEVKLSGEGRFGIQYNETATPDMSLESRFTLDIDTVTESDNGLVFGANVRMRANEDRTGTVPARLSGARLYMKSGNFTVAVGNITGAMRGFPGVYANSVGLTGLGYGDTVITGGGLDSYKSDSAGANGVEAIYKDDTFAVHVSYSDLATAPRRLAGFVSAKFGGYTFAIGGQDSDKAAPNDEIKLMASIGGKIGKASFTLAYADKGAERGHIALSGKTKIGAATELRGYIAHNDNPALTDAYAYGVGFRHNLGGGASLRGGVANVFGATRADFGVRFAF